MNNIDIDRLRKELIDYYGTAMGNNPVAMIELSIVEKAKPEQLIYIAINNGFDLNDYLAQLKQIILNNSEKLDIEIETKIVNEAAIRSVMKNGFELYRQSDECLYFRLPEETKKHK